MKRSAGFTLIELIIVIVILGILAVTAAPKFINLQNDARSSTVNAMKGAVQAAASMAYSKAIIAGKDKTQDASDGITVNGTGVDLVYGYPAATADGIGNVIDAPASDWSVTSGSGTTYVLTPKDYSAPTGTSCNVTYTPATSTAAATAVSVVTGC